MSKITSIIIGLGNIGYLYDYNKSKKFVETHYRSITQNKKFKLLALVEKNISKKKSIYKDIQIPIFKNLNQLRSNFKNVDLFILATDFNTHFGLINQIIKFYNPKIIFCEKPFCKSEAESSKVIELCKKNKIKLVVNYQRRVDKNIIYLKKFLNFKKNYINVYYSKSIKTNASHFIDLFTFIFGKVVSIYRNKNNKKFNFSLKFKRAIVNFCKVSKDTKIENYFQIENKKFFISMSNKYFFVKNKKDNKISKLKTNTKILLQNNQELYKIFKNKKSLLCKGTEALNTHILINKIKYK